jgi:hypothetical protein
MAAALTLGFGLAACGYHNLRVTPYQAVVEPGGVARFQVWIDRWNFTQLVDLNTAPVSPQLTATFNPDPAPGATSTLEVRTLPSTPIGAYAIDVSSTPVPANEQFLGRPARVLAVAGPCGARWIRQFGNVGNDSAYDVAVDPSGNVYVLYAQTYPPGSGRLGSGHYLGKFAPDGAALWLRETPIVARPGAVAIDRQGNAYVGGFVLQAGSTVRGELAIVKYDSSGNILWRARFGGQNPAQRVDTVTDLTVSEQGVVYAVGYTNGDVGGPNADRTFTSEDGWLARINAAGAVDWVRQSSYFRHDSLTHVVVASSGSLFVRGIRAEPGIFDFRPFVRRYDNPVAAYDSPAWDRFFTEFISGSNGGLALDSAGAAYMAANIRTAQFPDGTVRADKLNAGTGASEWTWTFGPDLAAATGVVVGTGNQIPIVSGDFLGTSLAARMARVAANGLQFARRDINTTYRVGIFGAAAAGGSLYLVGMTNGSFGDVNRGMNDAWVANMDVDAAACWLMP